MFLWWGSNVGRCTECISWPALLRTVMYSAENRKRGAAQPGVQMYVAEAAAAFNPKKQSARAHRLLWAILTSTINPDDTLCRSAPAVNYPRIFSYRIISAGEFPRTEIYMCVLQGVLESFSVFLICRFVR